MEKLSNVQKRRKPDRVVDKSRPGTGQEQKNKKQKTGRDGSKARYRKGKVKQRSGKSLVQKRDKSDREVGKARYRKGNVR